MCNKLTWQRQENLCGLSAICGAVTLAHGCDGKHTVSRDKLITHSCTRCLSWAAHAMMRRVKQKRMGNTEDAKADIG